MPEENLADTMAKKIIDIDIECSGRITQAQEVRRQHKETAEKQYLVTVRLAKKHKGRQLHELREEILNG